MLRSITGFLFGSENTDDQKTESPVSSNSSSISKADEFLDPNEWVIVEGGSMDHLANAEVSLIKSSSLTNSVSDDHSDFEQLRGPYIDMRDLDPQNDAALSDVSSQPEILYNPSIEECWIVSPCPCFTGQDVSLEGPKSSSLEDLLIEHPSMSIYQLQGRPPLHCMIENSPSIISEMETSLVDSERKSESMERLEFHQPQEPLFFGHNLLQSPNWTSDSESSSLDCSFSSSRDGSNPVAFVNSEEQNFDQERHRNDNIDHLSPARGSVHWKCHIRMQTRTSLVNLERNNKAIQKQVKKKRKCQRKCFSALSSYNSKKKSS